MAFGVDRLYERFYPRERYKNEDELFDEAILRSLRAGSRVLDAGAGAGELFARDYRPLCREVVGVDLDTRVAANPKLTRGLVAPLERLPFTSEYFDLVYCRYVFEHLPDPAAVVREFSRILRPGGRAIIMTPNRYHYVTLTSAATPLWFHRLYNKWRGRDSADTFPTHYRANSRAALAKLFDNAGFDRANLRELEMAPNYLTLFAPAFAVGVIYERIVNRIEALSLFRVLLLGEFVKRG